MRAEAVNAASSPVVVRENWQALLELATSEVFEIMLGSKLQRCPGTESAVNSEFTAMVGLAGSLCGVLSMRCSAQAAGMMASKMLGIDPSEAQEQSWDAIGEVCNMIAGNFKAKLAGIGNHCMLSVPTIITGADYHLHSLADGGEVEVALMFEDSILWFTLEIHT
jgi:chemotaxis protein CheX